MSTYRGTQFAAGAFAPVVPETECECAALRPPDCAPNAWVWVAFSDPMLIPVTAEPVLPAAGPHPPPGCMFGPVVIPAIES